MEALVTPVAPRVAPASRADLAAASSILVEAAEWAIARGEPLWDPKDLTPERLGRDVEAGSLHLAWLADRPVGTIAVSREDPLFWPDVPAGESLFVHRLAVRRAVAGRGVALAMLDWARMQGRSAGLRWLRLDCSAAHPGLVAYYEGLGFLRCGERVIAEFRNALFQQEIDA